MARKLDYDGIADADGEWGRTVSIHNNVGGTTFLPKGLYKVKVLGGFNDYETGRIIHGRLVDPEQVEIARKAGMVHQPDWRIPALPEGRADRVLQTLTTFDPSFVLFNAGGGCWKPVEKPAQQRQRRKRK